MLRLGTRVRVVDLFDPNATDEAVGRRVKLGETGVITENDPHRMPRDHNSWDCWLVKLDAPGRESYLCRDEIEREDRAEYTRSGKDREWVKARWVDSAA